MSNVLVTGANRGIGLAFVTAYLQHGDRVIATRRHPAEAYRLQELQQAYGEAVTILPMDVTDPEQIAACRDAVAQDVDALHVLINNAGILRHVERLAEIQLHDLMDSFQVNAAGPVLVAQASVELLSAGAPSKLVNITMPTPPISRWPRRDNQIYVASCYALNALTKMIALELGDLGIITIGLYPGFIQTDMNDYSPQAVPAEEGIPKVVLTIDRITTDSNGLAYLPDGTVYEW
jgi:NAD(P)-dependent dehydrogenase (short-subunit alcohol dehydrogenase family)